MVICRISGILTKIQKSDNIIIKDNMIIKKETERGKWDVLLLRYNKK